ncbi:MAG: hypothetical protein FJY83_04630 [Candidatus Aminicenantes bacterium]|nr:hypothetical protein [Candidatus Aminicenantes bacterium]
MKMNRAFLVLPIMMSVLFLLSTGCGTKAEREEAGHLPVSLDGRGPYLILHTARAGADYGQAVELARRMHPDAGVAELDLSGLDLLQSRLRELRPHYCLIFIKPDELDVNLAWKWLALSAALDDDPFVDVRTGFITGESPSAVLRFVKRIDDAVRGALKLPAALIDNLGPNSGMQKDGWLKQRGSFMLPALAAAIPTHTISHGPEGFTKERLGEMGGAGLIHFGGHGYPDRVVDCLNGPFARRVPFSPSVVFNGACYTGVTGRWFDIETGAARPRSVPPAHAFSLGILANQAVAYLAALHPDHGIPVYQEMDFLAYTGSSLGEVMKHTHDGVILAWGGKPLSLKPLEEGSPSPRTPAEIMLTGTASRVLFGDPALKVMEPVTAPPLDAKLTPESGRVIITARVKNPALKTTFSDTYYADLSRTGQFNDRLLITCEWTERWRDVGGVAVESLKARGEELPRRLVGWAFEEDGGRTLFHVQVDVLSTGYLESPLRTPGAECRVVVSR